MKKDSKKSYIIIISILVLSFVVFLILKADNKIVDKTYCSDLCPSESEYVPFQVYKKDITAEECTNQSGTPNYAYGWSNEYLGCTPEGYKSLSEATEEMWSNQNN